MFVRRGRHPWEWHRNSVQRTVTESAMLLLTKVGVEKGKDLPQSQSPVGRVPSAGRANEPARSATETGKLKA
jgi:hypothetical protein